MTACHRFLLGGERAEAQALRERAQGHASHYLDCSADPWDYSGWDVCGADCLCYAVESVTPEYAQALGFVLIAQGARIVGIFDAAGNCLFGRFPAEHNQQWRSAA